MVNMPLVNGVVIVMIFPDRNDFIQHYIYFQNRPYKSINPNVDADEALQASLDLTVCVCFRSVFFAGRDADMLLKTIYLLCMKLPED